MGCTNEGLIQNVKMSEDQPLNMFSHKQYIVIQIISPVSEHGMCTDILRSCCSKKGTTEQVHDKLQTYLQCKRSKSILHRCWNIIKCTIFLDPCIKLYLRHLAFLVCSLFLLSLHSQGLKNRTFVKVRCNKLKLQPVPSQSSEIFICIECG